MCLKVEDQPIALKGSKTRGAAYRPRVAVAGLGVVGEGAALYLAEHADSYELCAALVRDANKPRDEALASIKVFADPEALLATQPDIIIDALPSGPVGRKLIEAAIVKGISIVTANKQAIASVMAPLHAFAAHSGAVFAYSASVGGGSPMIETARKARAQGRAHSIYAILNGTVNYILSAMKEGATFDAAVKAAQEAGFAEPDPTADLSGEDARAKISILTYEVFGEEIDLDAINVEALTADLADDLLKKGGAWKQLSTITKTETGEITARVAYERVDGDPFFREVTGEGNALRILNTDGQTFTCEGKGAGRAPTVASIVSDLERIAKERPFE